MMNQLFYIAIGGAIGSVFRFILSNTIAQKAIMLFPLGTFTVNLLGCFGLGYFYGYVANHPFISLGFRVLVGVGFFGGFTTFSTFSLESFYLLRDGNYFLAITNMFLSIILGLIFVGIGFQLHSGLGK